MSRQSELLDYLFDAKPHTLSSELPGWLDASPRFMAFAETYRDKIRKKIRLAGNPESALDLRAELQVVQALLADRRFEAVYEPYASAKLRGPDFSVTYRVNTVFNIEVARIRAEGDESNLPRIEERLLRILLGKLGQMQAGQPNLLVVHIRPELGRALELAPLMQSLKQRAEGREPAFYALSRYATLADFYKNFLHLAGVLLWAAGTEPWLNKQARPPLDEKIVRLVSALAQAVT
jgi:hypothetical protein